MSLDAQMQNKIHDAVAVLAAHARGRQVLQDLVDMLDRGGIALDCRGQQAVILLLLGSWTNFPGLTRDAMRDAIGPWRTRENDTPAAEPTTPAKHVPCLARDLRRATAAQLGEIVEKSLDLRDDGDQVDEGEPKEGGRHGAL